MIKRATLEDIPWIVDIACKDMFSLMGNPEFYNPTYLRTTLAPEIIKNGIVFVVEDFGLIGGLVTNHTMNPDKRILLELLWWVRENKRNSSIGYRLLKAFEEEAKNHYVSYIQMSLMESSTIKSLEKQGYVKKEYSLVKEI